MTRAGLRCNVELKAVVVEPRDGDISWLLDDNVLVVDVDAEVLALVEEFLLESVETVLDKDGAEFGIVELTESVALLMLLLLLFTVLSQDPLLFGKTRSPAIFKHRPFSNKLRLLYSSLGGGSTTTSTPSIAPNASSHCVRPISLSFCIRYTSICFNPPAPARSTPHCAQSSTYLEYFLKYGIYTVAHFWTKEFGVEAIE